MDFIDILLNDKQQDRFLKKIFKLDDVYRPHIVKEKLSLDAMLYETETFLHNVPKNVQKRVIKSNDTWGGEFIYGWFYLDLKNHKIDSDTFLFSESGSPESLVYVNDRPYGMFDVHPLAKDAIFRRHDYLRLNKDVKDIVINAYASHTFPGTMPYEKDQTFGLTIHQPIRTFKGFYLVRFETAIKKFVENITFLKSYFPTLNKIQKRRFFELCFGIYETIDFMPDTHFNLDNVIEANHHIEVYMKEIINNPEEKPNIYILGHSHLDTAWLWHFDETIKKFVETVSTAVRLLKSYPKYKFMMSSILHFEWIRIHQPELFNDVIELVKENKFEINGATFVEPDCNLTGSESMVRHFLRGQRWMKKYVGHYADAFFLPDTFGYSSAIPQIIMKSQAKYFLTTKMRWNDTNKFPYDTFMWEGLDQTQVLTHFNHLHVNPDPDSLTKLYKSVEHQLTTDNIFVTYGYGDGGGGSSEDMVKEAVLTEKIMKNPMVKHQTISEVMSMFSQRRYPVYKNELYLELHRATYTTNRSMKYYNRKAEFALHNLEFISAIYNINNKSKIHETYDILLKNQFHDVLPATSIKKANDLAIHENINIVNESQRETNEILAKQKTSADHKTIINLNGIDLEGIQILDGNHQFDSLASQTAPILGVNKTFVELKLDGYEIKTFETSGKTSNQTNAFHINTLKDQILSLENDMYEIVFDNQMFISKFFDKRVQRNIVAGRFNRLSIGHHIPLLWDNWDMDKDYEIKMKDINNLISAKVVTNGPLVSVIETIYKLTDKSTLTQNMVFYKHTPRVDFFNKIDWHDTHLILKTYFDTNIVSESFKSEIQFGYETRKTTDNNSFEQAQFEVMNHKWSYLGETEYGVSLMNDSLYGIQVKGGRMGLTLVTSGVKPDPTASRGTNYFAYSVVLNDKHFNAKDIISPSYHFNNPPIVIDGSLKNEVFAKVDDMRVIVETIKQGEDEGTILRLFESTGNHVNINLSFNKVFECFETNMLEEIEQGIGEHDTFKLTFRPFEIKTILIK